MHIGRVQRTLTVEPVEEPVPGHHRPAPVEPAPAEAAPASRRQEPAPAAAPVREEAMVG